MNENFDAFDNYAQQYNLNVDMIGYKYNHSYRVVHQAEEICRSINLDTVERDLASNIALLHDIARFRQWTNYKTFDDHESFDHGDEAVKILFEENEIKNFIIDENDYEVLKTAIKYHNKKDVPLNKLSEREQLHSKIIRDADKIDILYAFSTNRLLELKESDDEISPNVEESFFNHELVDKKDLKNTNDRIIMLIDLIFDLNYQYSKDRIKNEEYIEKMYSYLKNKKIFKPYVDEAIKYLKESKNVR